MEQFIADSCFPDNVKDMGRRFGRINQNMRVTGKTIRQMDEDV